MYLFCAMSVPPCGVCATGFPRGKTPFPRNIIPTVSGGEGMAPPIGLGCSRRGSEQIAPGRNNPHCFRIPIFMNPGCWGSDTYDLFRRYTGL